LYILELVRGLFEAGAVTRVPGGGWATPYDDSTRDYAELPIPPNLRETVLGRVSRLGQRTRRLLECASLAGERFSGAWLAGIEPDEFARLDALEAACRAELLEPDPLGFRFRHELLRRALDESQSPERRRAMHNALASQLEVSGAAPERIADHLERAGRAFEAVPYLERAAESAEGVYAYREALAHVERALESVRDAEHHWRLEKQRVTLLRQLTDLEAYRDGLDRLERLAEAQGQPDWRAQAYLQRGMYYLWRGQSFEAAQQAQRALELPGLPGPLEAEALYLVGHAQARLGQVSLALEYLSRAFERAQAEGDSIPPSLMGSIENGLTGAYLYLGDYERALESNARANTAFERVGDTFSLFTLSARGWIEMLLGRTEAARQTLECAIVRALEHGHPSAASFAYRYRATLELDQGETRAAERDILEGLNLCRGKNLRLEAQLEGLVARQLWFDGRLGEALEAAHTTIEHALELRVAPLVVELRLILAGFLIELGAFVTAQAELQAAHQIADELGDQGVLRPYQATLDILKARIEFAFNQPERALERLGATTCLENALWNGQIAHSIELARAMALNGDAPGALEHVQALELPPPLEPRALSVQLEAHLVLGDVPEDVLERALATLEIERAAPTDRLGLMVNLVRALEHLGRDARAVRALARATLDSLASSLEPDPGSRAGLLERFQGLLDG
jgi:tetratricopeptide (TPR) repeat protein